MRAVPAASGFGFACVKKLRLYTLFVARRISFAFARKSSGVSRAQPSDPSPPPGQSVFGCTNETRARLDGDLALTEAAGRVLIPRFFVRIEGPIAVDAGFVGSCTLGIASSSNELGGEVLIGGAVTDHGDGTVSVQVTNSEADLDMAGPFTTTTSGCGVLGFPEAISFITSVVEAALLDAAQDLVGPFLASEADQIGSTLPPFPVE